MWKSSFYLTTDLSHLGQVIVESSTAVQAKVLAVLTLSCSADFAVQQEILGRRRPVVTRFQGWQTMARLVSDNLAGSTRSSDVTERGNDLCT